MPSLRRPRPRAEGVSHPWQLANGAYSLAASELRALIAAGATPRDRALLQLLCETGMRRFEVTALRWADVDVVRRLVTVHHGKGGKERVIPVSVAACNALVPLAAADPATRVFHSRQSATLSVRQVNRIVARAGARAGLRHPNPRYREVTCHLLRHSFARLWKAQGGSIESLSHILGHSSVKTTWDVYGTESLPDVQRNYDETLKHIFRDRIGVKGENHHDD